MNIKYLLGIVTLLVVVSCAKEEALSEREQQVTSKFEFPQGDRPADKKLVEIYEKFGVRCIYKDITVEDLNKSWGTGTIGEAGMKGESLNDDKMVDFYTTFFYDNIFRYFNREMTQMVFPPNFYFVLNYVNKKSNPLFGVLPNAPEYYGEATPKVFDGLDFWGFCFVIEEYYSMSGSKMTLDFPVTVLDYKKLKEPILKNIFSRMLIRKIIAQPTFLAHGVATDLDYQTPVKSSLNEINDKNYYKRRGFCETLRNLVIYTSPANVSNIGSGTDTKVNMSPSLLFNDYLWLGLRYTREQIEINYAEFPLVLKYYKMVADYMLKNYNMDLNAMAQDPELIN